MLETKTDYCVLVQGSGLIGHLFGRDTFLDAYLLLKALRKKDQLKCFKWWCSPCRDLNLEGRHEFVSHVFSISFANIRNLLLDKEVNWKWDNPMGEWAKRIGDPTKFAQALLESKSRPSWKLSIIVIDHKSGGE